MQMTQTAADNSISVNALLDSQFRHYPKMQEQDVLKLLYQRNFGCGHLAPGFEAAFCCMNEEWELSGSVSEDLPLTETIGNSFSRLALESAKARGISPQALTRLFLMSADSFEPLTSEHTDAFRKDFETVLFLCENGTLSFDADCLRTLFDACAKNSYAPFCHSAQYREAYQPRYRVVREDFLPLLPLLDLPERLSQRPQDSVYTIAIDGGCASGKSTLATLLSRVLNAPVIRMDDFFLPPELRTAERLSEPGGNIHYERFTNEVANNIKRPQAFTYRRFDCHSMSLADTVSVPSASIRITEGVYALRPEWQPLYDTALFLTVDSALRQERILKRNGAAMLERFLREWIPMEESYFNANSKFLSSCTGLTLI